MMWNLLSCQFLIKYSTTSMPREYCNCHGTEHSLIEKDGFALMCKNCGNIYCQK